MNARRLAGLLVLSLPAVVSADDAPAAPPPAATPAAGWPVTFQTEEVSNDPVPGEKFRATQDFESVDLVESAPAGIAPPPDAGRVLWTRVGPKAKPAVTAVVRGEGDALAVFVDADANGTFGEGERHAATATPTTSGTTRTGTTWKVRSAGTTGAPVLLTFSETLPRWSGALAAPVAPGATKPDAPVRLEFTETAPAGAKAPEGFPASVRWATAEIQGQSVVVATARDADGVLRAAMTPAAAPTFAGERAATAKPAEMRQGKVRTGTRWSFEGPASGTVRANLTVVETLWTLTGRFTAATSRRGNATVGGVAWVVLLVDGDHDGRFASKHDLWYVGLGSGFRGATYANMFEATEPFRAAGPPEEAYRLVSVSEKGEAVVASEPSPGPLAAYLERRAERVNEGHWFPLFRLERDKFLDAHGIDGKRPTAAAPAHFRYAADFDEAKALAAQEGKPLLVDFEADWCVWCKRLDFYSYPDAAVVERLSKFTCVKISTDFDPKKTLKTLSALYGDGWGGLPAVGVFHADGTPVSFSHQRSDRPKAGDPAAAPKPVDHIAGFLPPAELVTALEAAHAAWAAGSRAVPLNPPPPAGDTPPVPAMGADSGK
jgi:thiol-disulfide isomerase/thioredoxin